MIDASILDDPVKFINLCWPDIRIYDKQAEILYSLRDNDETIVPAANQMGKDFITSLGVLWFMSSRSPVRIITSSSSYTQLSSVLWGEIKRFQTTSRIPLPIHTNELYLRQIMTDGEFEPRSYVKGIVSKIPETLLGHHLERGPNGKPRTLVVYDEASSIEDVFWDASDTWAHRKLVIGNCLPCSNFFKRKSKEGDLRRLNKKPGYITKVIKIRAEDSPNVQYALAEMRRGLEPSYTDILPGVLSYELYEKRRKIWDPIRQKIGLDAEFYEGAENLLFPPDWLDYSEKLETQLNRTALTYVGGRKAMGVDPGEGTADTSFTIVDKWGIVDKLDIKTPNTREITTTTIKLIKTHGLNPEDVMFDRGGGGKQIVDQLRSEGYDVRSVGFGSKVVPPIDLKIGTAQKTDIQESRYTFLNLRAQMYWKLRERLTPLLVDEDKQEYRVNFCIPARYTELRRQLAPLPYFYDEEGRIFLPPKSKPTPTYTGKTIVEILGGSPDQADSLVLATWAYDNVDKMPIAGLSLLGDSNGRALTVRSN